MDEQQGVLQDAIAAYWKRDYAAARAGFEALAAAGDAEGEVWLGALHANGEGVPADLTAAFEWYMRAARRGHAIAQTNVGAMLAMGRGVAADRESGIAWLELAAAQDDANACFNLGTLFHKDDAAPADLAKAAHYYERAARLGHFPSQARLGYLYSHGKGVEKNRVTAFMWLSLAAQHGVGSVLNELEALGAQMSIEEKREGMGRLEEFRSRTRPMGPPPRLNPMLG